ncbi:MAG TPA: aminotransferase class V-fold PLP-dependent enzyme, partial [Thermomicrobiales bacterium]
MATTERITSLISKDAFLRVAEVAHLCAGGETAILRSHNAAVERFFALKSDGFDGREVGVMGLLQRTRERASELLGVPPGDIAFLNSASEGLGQLAAGLDWRPGDNVVVEDIEFPSGLYPWTRLAAQGVEVRLVRQEGGEATIDRLAAALDDRTRVLAVSQVSYLTGRRYDLAELRALADRHGALLSVDATHAAGVVPVAAQHADLLVSSCYKFLLGVHGAAILYCNPQRLGNLQPQSLGWHSVASHHTVAAPTDYTLRPTAARFEAGNPPFMALAVLENALETLATIGVERIERHVLALGGLLHSALQARGLTLLTPEDPARRGPNICFSWPDSVGLVAALAAHGILVWGGDGRVRVSFHAYNDEDDVARLLTALDACLTDENT